MFKNKKNLIIIILITLLVITGIVFIFTIKKSDKDIKYSCGRTGTGPYFTVTEIIYVTRTNNKITTQDVRALYYDDNEKYNEIKESSANNSRKFDDETQTITITEKKESVKKKLSKVLKELEDEGYECKEYKEE